MQTVGQSIASKSGIKHQPPPLSPECKHHQTTGPTKPLTGQGASSPSDPPDPSPPISPTQTVAGQQGSHGGALPPPSDPGSSSSPSGEERALLKETNKKSEDQERARSIRQALRTTSRNISPNRRHQSCGHANGGDVILNALGERIYGSGLRSCGSVWECPICSHRISMQRAKEAEEVLHAHLDAGGGAMFQTLTTPHDPTDRLKKLRVDLGTAWTAAKNLAPWKGVNGVVRQLGIQNVIRSLEGTVGRSGWHPHLHNLILTERPLTEEEGEQLRHTIYNLWADQMEKRGYRRPAPKRCQLDHVSRRDVGRYLSKFGAALELVSGRGKGARNGNRTPWEVLADYREHGRAEDRILWKEWVTGMKGARQLTGLSQARKRLGLAEPKSDEDVAEVEEVQTDQAELEEKPRQVARINPKAWAVVQRTEGAQDCLFEVAARRGYEGVREYLDDLCRWPPGEETARPPITWEDEDE